MSTGHDPRQDIRELKLIQENCPLLFHYVTEHGTLSPNMGKITNVIVEKVVDTFSKETTDGTKELRMPHKLDKAGDEQDTEFFPHLPAIVQRGN